MSHGLVDSQEELAQVCADIRATDHVALDTEFIRQKTYHPQLCLIQIAVNDSIYCVDPLAFDDIQELMQALCSVRVVIHSARQDLEAFFQSTGVMLPPVFDTQIAAGLCGLGDQISYAALVNELLQVELGKGETRTDWSQRPLTDAQKKYAEDDVRYLREFYPLLQRQLEEMGRTQWHAQECEHLSNEKLYVPDPNNAWRRVKGVRGLDRKQRRIMKRLAAWRERQADQKDKPRKWIMSDEDIVKLAAEAPGSADQVEQLLASNQRFLRQSSSELQAQIAAAEDDPLEEKFVPNSPDEMKLIKLCMERLRQVATDHNMSPALLGTRKDITAVVRGEESPLLRDWRHELIGQQLQEMLAENNGN